MKSLQLFMADELTNVNYEPCSTKWLTKQPNTENTKLITMCADKFSFSNN